VNDAPSLSVSDAGYRLGVSASTIKRLIRDNELAWFRTRGPNGHIRVLAESVEKFRQPGESRSVPAAGLVAGKRENVEALRAEIEERKLKRDLSRLDEEDGEVKRQREAMARAEELEREHAVEQTRVQLARDAAERRARELEKEEAEERRAWTNRWITWALNAVPKGVPREAGLDVHQSVEDVLARLSPKQPRSVVQRLVLAAVSKALQPWRRRVEIEKIIADAPNQLPWGARGYPALGEPSEWYLRAQRAATDAIAQLESDVPLAKIRAAAIEAANAVAREYEAQQARTRAEAQAERDRQQREAHKMFLVSVGVACVSPYISKLHLDGEIWDDDLVRRSELETAVHKALQDKLTGDESFEDAKRIARELVDAELESK
jgi:excisionase family DNA binding protein